MTAPDDAVAAIDAALEAWESGPDAYRQNAPTGVGNSSRVPESTSTPEGPQIGAQGRTGALPEGADEDDDVDTIGWAASRQAWEEQAQWWPEMPQ